MASPDPNSLDHAIDLVTTCRAAYERCVQDHYAILDNVVRLEDIDSNELETMRMEFSRLARALNEAEQNLTRLEGLLHGGTEESSSDGAESEEEEEVEEQEAEDDNAAGEEKHDTNGQESQSDNQNSGSKNSVEETRGEEDVDNTED